MDGTKSNQTMVKGMSKINIHLLLNRSMVRCGLEIFGDEDFGEERFTKTITRQKRSSEIFGDEDSTPILSVRSRNVRNCCWKIWQYGLSSFQAGGTELERFFS